MIWNVEFDPIVDLKEVDQFGYIDLRQAITDGFVPASAQVESDGYNDIEDLGSIVGKPSDVFEAMQYGVSVQNSSSSDNGEEGAYR